MRDSYCGSESAGDLSGDPEDSWLYSDALSFNNYDNAATIIDDEGWNGKSVRMGTKVDWNTSYTPPIRGKYRLLASLRCEGTIQEGRLGSRGVRTRSGLERCSRAWSWTARISRAKTARSTENSAGLIWG